MADQLTPRQFHEATGIGDWRVLFTGACTYFRTGSFARGAALVQSITQVAEAANHHPDVDIRYGGVSVRLWSHDVDGLSDRDVALARDISAAAAALGIEAEPSAVQDVQISIDASNIPAIIPFWRAVLGYRQLGDEDLVDGAGRGPTVWFQQMDQARPQRNRIHLDVAVPQESAEARIAAALAAGGVLVSDEHAPTWWTLADAEGNEVDVAVIAGRG
jgi:4a-hydroxytetrahydrobiopterin dehydratase